MTLFGFRGVTICEHLERVKQFYSYLSKMSHAAIQIRTDEPYYSNIPDFEYDDWSQTIYGEVTEHKLNDAPKAYVYHKVAKVTKLPK
jgi:hypothetical protein